VLRTVFELKREEVTGRWRKMHSDMFHDMYSSPNIIMMMKSWKMRRAGNVACMRGNKNIYNVLTGKPERRII
jgi:hypothetical protein